VRQFRQGGELKERKLRPARQRAGLLEMPLCRFDSIGRELGFAEAD
jgi:hypothetical protein